MDSFVSSFVASTIVLNGGSHIYYLLYVLGGLLLILFVWMYWYLRS